MRVWATSQATERQVYDLPTGTTEGGSTMLRLVWGPDKYDCYATQTVPVGLLKERLDKLGEEHGEINVTIVPARDYDADQALDLHVTGHEAHE